MFLDIGNRHKGLRHVILISACAGEIAERDAIGIGGAPVASPSVFARAADGGELTLELMLRRPSVSNLSNLMAGTGPETAVNSIRRNAKCISSQHCSIKTNL